MSGLRVHRVHPEPSVAGARAIARLVSRGEQPVDRRILRTAARIVEEIRRGGDRALLAAVERYDGTPAKTVGVLRRRLRPESLVSLPAGFGAALDRSIAAVERYHSRQLEAHGSGHGFHFEDDGVSVLERRIPLRRVGLYVPGGRFAYPSSAVMTVVPARLAGVEQIVVVTPPRALESSLALRQTLVRLGVEEVWGIGGAQAIAALAFGTETIERVDLIAGPGNAWVAAAKRHVAGRVGVDREAGPSEVVIVASGDAPADLVAADLLAQAEHDPLAAAVLITDDPALARRVAAEVSAQLDELGLAEVARQSLSARSCGLLVGDLESGLELVERIAPEHLQLIGAGAEPLAERVRSAGAVFVGASAPCVFGDYVAGPSHVLPTGGTARFASGLGVDDFVRRSHTVRYSGEAVFRAAADAEVMARVEGLHAHAAAARWRGAPQRRGPRVEE